MGKAKRCVTLSSELHIGPAESKTLSMRGHFMHENREVSAVSIVVGWIGRGKRTAYAPGMHAAEKSDIGVVPVKGPNKTGQNRWRRFWREGR